MWNLLSPCNDVINCTTNILYTNIEDGRNVIYNMLRNITALFCRRLCNWKYFLTTNEIIQELVLPTSKISSCWFTALRQSSLLEKYLTTSAATDMKVRDPLLRPEVSSPPCFRIQQAWQKERGRRPDENYCVLYCIKAPELWSLEIPPPVN